jgi:hypothetical protein
MLEILWGGWWDWGFLPPPYTSVGCIEEVNGCWDAMIAPKIVIDLDAGSTVDV